MSLFLTIREPGLPATGPSPKIAPMTTGGDMEIGARLVELELTTPRPQALAAHYASAFDMAVEVSGEDRICRGPERVLRLSAGDPGQLRRAVFAFASEAAWSRYAEALRTRGVALDTSHPGVHTVHDPQGRAISFMRPPAAQAQAVPGARRTGRLQHFAVRTPDPQALVSFYVEQLGFVLSDRVLDDAGALSAAFLRTDAEHHALAIFRAAVPCFDHFSCETGGWLDLRDWADHMAEAGIPLAWGVGRHGPGNDTFFMVRDADGNMAEISCDLELCAPGRPAGVWPHAPSTLNRWGVALMRS
jgi:catechol 2,3-dioxygenase